MGENRTPRRLGRRWLMIGIAAGVVVLILAAFMAIDYATRSGREQPGTLPTATNPTAVVAAGITVGSGGTTVGADGVTRVGYAGTCDGAVQAATNYYTALTDVYTTSDEKKIALINQVVLPGTTKDALLGDANTRLNVQKTAQGNAVAKGFTQTTHVEWGGAYKVSDCTPERTAMVQILYCLATTFDGKSEKPAVDCRPDTVRLLWTGGDWKVVSTGDPIPGVTLNVTANIAGWEPSVERLPMPAAIRDAYLLNAETGTKDEGWVDYAGIARK